MFCDAVNEVVAQEIRDASAKWSDALHVARRKQGLEKWFINPRLAGSPPTAGTYSSDAPAHVPPPILASYPPIAEYTNALLTTLNGLRLLAPVKIMGDLLAVLDEVLAESAKLFLANASESESGTDDGAREAVTRAAGAVFVRVFVPFVRRALVEGVYGVKNALGSAGQSYEVDFKSELGQAVRAWEAWLADATKTAG
jgi:hypothetical protein